MNEIDPRSLNEAIKANTMKMEAIKRAAEAAKQKKATSDEVATTDHDDDNIIPFPDKRAASQ